MRKIFISIFVIFLISKTIAYDNTTDNIIKLDIYKSIELGIKNNLLLKNSKIDLDNKLLILSTSWNKYLPKSNLDFSYGGSTKNENEYLINLSLRDSVDLGPTGVFDVIGYVYDYQKGKITYETAESKLKKDIKKYYFNLIILREKINLKKYELDNAKLSYNTALVKFEDGIISIVDKLKSEYAYMSIIPELRSIESEYNNMQNIFKQMLGINKIFNIELTTSIPDNYSIDGISDKSFLVDNSNSIKSLIYDIKNLINSRNTNIASLTPSLSLSYSLPGIKNNQPDFGVDIGLSLSLSLDNFFPFSQAQRNLITSQRNIIKINNQLQDEKEKLEIEVNNIISNIEDIEKSIENYNLSIDIAEKTYLIVKKLFEGGLANYIELNDSERNLYNSRLNRLSVSYKYISYIFDLEYIFNKEILIFN